MFVLSHYIYLSKLTFQTLIKFRAEQQGIIKVGDEIIEINFISVVGKELEAIVEALKWPLTVIDIEDTDSIYIKKKKKVEIILNII